MKKLSIVLLMFVALLFSQNIYAEGISITERIIGEKLLEEQQSEIDTVTKFKNAIDDKIAIVVIRDCFGFLYNKPFSCVTRNFYVENNYIAPKYFKLFPNCFPQNYTIPQSYVNDGIGILYIGMINTNFEGSKVYYSWVVKNKNFGENGQVMTIHSPFPDESIRCINRAIQHSKKSGLKAPSMDAIFELSQTDEKMNSEFLDYQISLKREEEVKKNRIVVKEKAKGPKASTSQVKPDSVYNDPSVTRDRNGNLIYE